MAKRSWEGEILPDLDGRGSLEMDIDDFTIKKKKKKKKKSFCTPNFELGHETKNVHHYDNTINSFFPPLLCNFLYRYVMIKLCTAPSLIVVSIILDFENLPLRRKKIVHQKAKLSRFHHHQNHL